MHAGGKVHFFAFDVARWQLLKVRLNLAVVHALAVETRWSILRCGLAIERSSIRADGLVVRRYAWALWNGLLVVGEAVLIERLLVVLPTQFSQFLFIMN